MTTATAAVAPHWDQTALGFLAHGKSTPAHLEAALSEDPDFALGHAARGLFCLLLGRRELIGTAEQCWKVAVASAQNAPITRRETAFVEALRAWLDGWPSRSADILDSALVKAPNDALLVKMVHAIRFVLGDATGMRRSIETVSKSYDANHPAYGYILGCRAFALEETGEYKAAEAAGREGLDHAADDAWGLHAVAHVHDMTGNSENGISWLESRPASWAHCNNFGYHVWWHLALMYLDRGDADKALVLYDTEIRRDQTDDYRDISNAASLLSRLEIEGINVGGRWDELAHLSDQRAEDGCNVFADLHYLLALLNGGRRLGAERLLTSLRERALQQGDLARISKHAGVSTGAGLEQYRLGNYASAYTMLTAARGDLFQVGGSHAQRDVFERITIDAALRAGLSDEAEGLLHDRAHKRGAFDSFAERRLAVCERMRKASLIMEDERLRATPA
ncbi:tetratricopeptide repeat protein [Roseibium sp. RKSG952]|uniref:tetratricopeptide repeat protein n=1 Tax=Roseibium sp. RKSG952 TaxID=2529384 RepID=UPI001AD8EBCB|nr:tetratricopeptide repeat protein [Roseibium sp. RKSG952]